MKRLVPNLSRLLIAAIVVTACCAACTQPKKSALEWPTITREAKPWSRWWWQGSSVTKEGITAALEECQKVGLGGLEITPIYGVIGDEGNFIDYLSPQWMDMLEHTLNEAERLGLGIDMATGTGWPFGGPWVAEDDACKYMAHKEFVLKAGEKLREPVRLMQEPIVRAVPNQVYQAGTYQAKGEKVTSTHKNPEELPTAKKLELKDLVEPVSANKNLQALALDQIRFEKPMPLQVLMAYSDQGQTLNLTDKVAADGMLDWTTPEGNWTLYALFQGWHGKMVERAAPGGEGNVIDHFSAPALRHYLGKFDEALQGRQTKTLRAFFNDSYEVDDARGQADFTPTLFDEFIKRRGYDLREQLPALFGKDSDDQNLRVRSDYRETISDMLLEYFTQVWAKWARDKGAIIRNQAHGSPANILDLYAAVDIPETEGTDIIKIKMASSAAHVTGKKFASSESATWLKEHFLSNLADVKENIDRYLAGGVNHVFYHGTCYSPAEEPWPGRLFYAAIHANPRNPLWADWSTLNQYIARSQSFLQSGQPDNDVLVYFPVYDRFAQPGQEMLEHFDGGAQPKHGKETTRVRQLLDSLQAYGYSFDLISDRQILALGNAGTAVQCGGLQYQTIIVPATQYMPLATMEKLLKLAEAGTCVVFKDQLPGSVPGWKDHEQRAEQLKKRCAGLRFDEKGVAKTASGRVVLGSGLQNILTQADISRESLVDLGLQFTRRKDDAGSFYFISNWSGQDVDAWVPLEKTAGDIAIFDPMTGLSGLAAVTQSVGAAKIRLQLAKGESCIVRCFTGKASGNAWPYLDKAGPAQELKGGWKLSFLSGGPELPPAVELSAPGYWTDLEGEALQRFSGTASYKLEFARPQGKAQDGWLLDLGKVAETARVRLNGKDIGTAIGPVYTLRIAPELLQDNNLLEVGVSNLMANRIAGMERDGVLWKKFYNVNFPAHLAENRNKNGLFDASGWAPRPSGLLGPVTLTLLK